MSEIGTLYHLNDERLKVRHDAAAFAVADGALRTAVTRFGERGEEQLREANIHPARRKVLESLGDHWTGLTVFVEHPEVPMDNNTAERSERGPVVGRKNYYGSGSVWSGQLAAMQFSLLQTLCLWGLNPRLWLSAYLSVCGSRWPRRRMWTASCRGISLRSSGVRGAVTRRSLRRTRRSPAEWSGSDEEFQSQTPQPAWTRPGTGTLRERKQAGLPNA